MTKSEQELREILQETQKRFTQSYQGERVTCSQSVPVTTKSAPDEHVAPLLKAIRAGAVTTEKLCDTLGLCPRDLRAIIAKAKDAGFAVDVSGEWIGSQPKTESTDNVLVRMPAAIRGVSSFAVASDIHLGSKHHKKEFLEDFVDKVYAKGCRTILIPGDLLDGVYKFSIWDQNRRGFDEQAVEAIDSLPMRQGLSWVWILGNHDETFNRESGLDVGTALVNAFHEYGRSDLRCVGARGAYVRLATPGVARGLVIEMWHPKGSPAYSISYKPQRHVEGYAVGQKPDVMLCGHFHQAGYFIFRGVHCVQAGTFQGGQSAFGRSIGGSPSIGGWLCTYGMTEHGTVRQFVPEWYAYYEGETPRDIGLG